MLQKVNQTNTTHPEMTETDSHEAKNVEWIPMYRLWGITVIS